MLVFKGCDLTRRKNMNKRERFIVACEKILDCKPLPPLLNRKQIQALGIRNVDSLVKDIALNTGLLPIVNAKVQGKVCKYLTEEVIDYALGLVTPE